MGKTSFIEKLGYAFASLGDSVAYGFISVFLMFYLTTIAGISPGIAGTISAVGAVWNALFNPVMGYFADKVRSRFGRRRPLMFAFAFPLAAMIFLLFTNVTLPPAIKPVYYGFLLMMYWTCYTGFFVPYLALGADYTADYDDRTVLRLFGSFFNMIGSAMYMVLPTIMVDFLGGWDIPADRAWSITALFLGIVTAATILITVLASKGRDLPCETPKEKKPFRPKELFSDIFKEYFSVVKLKPIKYLIVAGLCSLIGGTMVMSDIVYMLTYNAGFSGAQVSAYMVLRPCMSILLIPVVGKLIIITDRRETLIGFYVLGAIGMIFFRFADLPVSIWPLVYMFFATLCTAIYWQIMPGIFYDVCEYDRILNGKNRSATIVSFQGLIEAFAAGLGSQLLGLILEAGGFDGEASVQTAEALVWIENAGTVIPIIFLLISSVALYKYPITKKAYNEMLAKDNARSED